jgi:hypothetical protein
MFPGGALAFAELNGLGEVSDRLRTTDHVAALLDSPQYQAYEASSAYQKVQAVREIVERQLGWDVWTAARKLLGGNVAVAAYPKEGSKQPDVLVILRTSEPSALTELRARLEPVVVLAAEQLQRTEELSGVESFKFPKGGAFLAWKESWAAFATSRSLLDGALARLTNGSAEDLPGGLLADASFQVMMQSTDWQTPVPGAENRRLLRGYLNMSLLSKAAGGKGIPEKLDNPLGSLLFGDVAAMLRSSPFAAVTLDAHRHGVKIAATLGRDAQKLNEPYRAFAPAEGPGVVPLPRVRDLIGGFTLYRNFAQWYAHRDELLQEQALPGFDKFETGLANLLPGRDFGEDVLPLIGQRLTFVAAPQSYAHLDGEPGVKLPGMALVIELAQPDEAAELLQLFFQTLAAVLNLEAGQQGRQPWVVTSENYHDVQVSYARYLKKPAGNDLGVVFNFLPASARVGDRFILSSSLPLCKQLIDALQQPAEDDPNESPRTIQVELHFDSLAKIVESNTGFFVGRMTQEGRTTEEAKTEFSALMNLLRRLDDVQAATEVLPDAFKLRLEGTWK